MCNIDLEPCSVWRETKHKARRRYVCHCCGGHIEPGVIYTAHFSIFDGDTTTERMCAPCQVAVDDFHAVHGQRANPSSMGELFYECLSEENAGYDDNDDPILTADGAKWKRCIDEMKVRREQRLKKERA